MVTRVFDGIIFCEQFLKRTSQGTFLPSLVQIGLAVWEEKMFKEIVDDGHIITLKAPLEHVVLRRAKKTSDRYLCLLQRAVREMVFSYFFLSNNVLPSMPQNLGPCS